jgi:hypothetical protein
VFLSGLRRKGSDVDGRIWSSRADVLLSTAEVLKGADQLGLGGSEGFKRREI